MKLTVRGEVVLGLAVVAGIWLSIYGVALLMAWLESKGVGA
jgi:hypothetical protein